MPIGSACYYISVTLDLALPRTHHDVRVPHKDRSGLMAVRGSRSLQHRKQAECSPVSPQKMAVKMFLMALEESGRGGKHGRSLNPAGLLFKSLEHVWNSLVTIHSFWFFILLIQFDSHVLYWAG